MEKTMMLPAMYNVLSQEEMTYTEGGATMTQALLAALLPPYGWYKASTEIRDYRKKNPNTWLDTGLDDFVAGCEKNVTSAIYVTNNTEYYNEKDCPFFSDDYIDSLVPSRRNSFCFR